VFLMLTTTKKKKMSKYILRMPVREVTVTNIFIPDRPGIDGHSGVDLGWRKNANQEIYACADGVVVASYYNSTRGHGVYVEHKNGDRHFWTAYIHLLKASDLKPGDKVKRGQIIGYMGTTGKSRGEHLHLYLTETTDKPYTYDTMRSLVIDPLPQLYCDTNVKYDFAPDFNPQWHDFAEYPAPVERDHSKHQVQINSDTRRLRKSPDTKAEPYPELCKRGIYNVIQMVADSEGNDYRWANIRDGFWVSVMSTDDEYQDYRTLYRRAAEEITDLKSTMKIYETQKEVLTKQRDTAEEKLKKIREIMEL